MRGLQGRRSPAQGAGDRNRAKHLSGASTS